MPMSSVEINESFELSVYSLWPASFEMGVACGHSGVVIFVSVNQSKCKYLTCDQKLAGSQFNLAYRMCCVPNY